MLNYSQLANADQANLRAACKVLDGSIQHLFFSCLVLKTGGLRAKAGLEFLAALASGETGWSRHVKTLRVEQTGYYTRDPSADELDSNEVGTQALRSALASVMKRIRMVT